MKRMRGVVRDQTEVVDIFRVTSRRVLERFGFDECEVVNSSNRMSWSWARAYGRKWKITVNVRGISVSGMTREQVIDLVKHEAAHLITWGRYGKDGHGKLFKGVCQELDCSPSSLCTRETPIGYQAWLNARRRRRR